MNIRHKINLLKFIPTEGSTLAEIGILIGLVAILGIVSIDALGSKVSNSFETLASNLSNPLINTKNPITDPTTSKPDNPTSYSSCNQLYEDGYQTTAVYQININDTLRNVQCVMLSADRGQLAGGWTAISRQFEGYKVPWGKGVSADFDFESSHDIPFSLSDDQIPVSTSIAFGRGLKDGSIEIIDGYSVILNWNSILNWLSGTSSTYIGMGSIQSLSLSDPSLYRTWAFAKNIPNSNENSIAFVRKEISSGTETTLWRYNLLDPQPQTRGTYASYSNPTLIDDFGWMIFVR